MKSQASNKRLEVERKSGVLRIFLRSKILAMTVLRLFELTLNLTESS